jgi:hypothetical protein
MLFGDIDWGQVLMKGLIGGVIGGVVGLVMYLFKKKPAPDKPDPDDGPKSGRGDW